MSDPRPTSTDGIGAVEAQPELPWRLPRRDYVLLPLIFVMTIVALLVGGEAAARLLYPQDDAAEPCEYNTPGGARYKPFCTSTTKVWEGPWITQHFNDCGYRAAESCAPRPVGSLRVVVVGSSTARGALVNYPDSFAAQASAALSARCGGTVDFQNLGTEPTDVDRIDLRMSEALALQPAAIVMTISDFDLSHLKDIPSHIADAQAGRFSLRNMVTLLRESRLFLVMQYYLYRDPAFQIQAFLLNTESADYVRSPLSQVWQHHLADFGGLLDRIVASTRRAHVPLLVLYLPGRAQAALAAMPSRPPGVDPLALGVALGKVAAAHGAEFFDTTEAIGTGPDFQSSYYLTDGHLKAAGHAVLASMVERALLAEPNFARCQPTASSR